MSDSEEFVSAEEDNVEFEGKKKSEESFNTVTNKIEKKGHVKEFIEGVPKNVKQDNVLNKPTTIQDPNTLKELHSNKLIDSSFTTSMESKCEADDLQVKNFAIEKDISKKCAESEGEDILKNSENKPKDFEAKELKLKTAKTGEFREDYSDEVQKPIAQKNIITQVDKSNIKKVNEIDKIDFNNEIEKQIEKIDKDWDREYLDEEDDNFPNTKVEKKSTTKTENEDNAWDDFGDDEDWIATDEIKKNANSNQLLSKDLEDASLENNTEPLENNPSNSMSWNNWKPWGMGGMVTSLLSTATEGVTSLTSHVSQVLESSIGIPDPEEMVKINQKLEEKQKSVDGSENSKDEKVESKSTLIGIVSGVTSIGNKVISGGLDTLEEIGKKTMNILQENDPLLLNKRRIIGLEPTKPNLSQILREAKEKSEELERNMKQAQKQSYKKQLHFESLFDHYYGLIHLEALEMLSKQCEIKLQTLMSPLSGKALDEMKETLNEVKELCEIEDIENDDHDIGYSVEELDSQLKIAIEDFNIKTDFSEIIECWRKNLNYIEENNEDANDIFEKGLRCLAETCALQMTKMHKIAELLIIKDTHCTVSEADSLVQITKIFSHHLKGIANNYCSKLNQYDQTEEVKSSITNIFLEVYNSVSYVQSAFKLFIPILQVGAA